MCGAAAAEADKKHRLLNAATSDVAGEALVFEEQAVRAVQGTGPAIEECEESGGGGLEGEMLDEGVEQVVRAVADGGSMDHSKC